MNRADPQLQELVDRALAALGARGGGDRIAVAQAPGRVNLIGEHVDYNGGLVLPMAIDRWIVAAGSVVDGADRGGGLTCLDVHQANVIEWERLVRGDVAELPNWARYVAGAIAVFPGGLPVMDVVIHSNIPVGAGLSSSAALCVCLLTLFESLTGHELGAMEKALLAQRVEHEFLGVPCGLMDQLASVFGKRDHALCIDCGENHRVRQVRMPGGDRLAILIVNTGVSHELASSEYGLRRRQCEEALAVINAELDLSLKTLGRVTFEMFEACEEALDEVLMRRARHVVTEIERTRWAVTALEAGDLPALGKLLHASHVSLREDYEVSCAELDCIVEAAGTVSGVFGARMTGAGFGGCAIVLCEPGAVEQVSEVVRSAFEHEFHDTPEIWRVKAVDGASGIEG